MANSESLIDGIIQFIEDIYTELEMSPQNHDTFQFSHTVQSSPSSSEDNLSGDANAGMINRHEATGNSAPTTISASHESSTRTPHSSPRALPGTPPQRPRHLSTRARRNNLAFSPNIVIDLSETQSPPRRSNLQPQPQPPLGTGSSLLDNSDVILMEPNEVIDLCTPKPQTPRRRHCIHIECSSHGVLRSRRAITMAPRNTAPTDDGVLQKKCPICLEAIHQPTATICGHVFCRTCIKQAITVNHKCPMCKTKTDKRGLRRIYL